ncbi:uncharacterized protein CTHT_0043310 [Thermochaetoides thermophila DSM 1495]|uniref:VWFA domain-containing protein n=1 Tax=Chaetomium thermophilum (strain DSM 1495 / CBS 144.50 / IMI 039719) TaxID=759272 RepID=G0SAS4_CHATD|nr:hypothetical protein CTHT_0043310 [Thermochaetoides thermophila DSM 1495]EGS19846.1 hypothetical protein CTHT_0043310 [Thermochaetoides thermophila DSM 1495]
MYALNPLLFTGLDRSKTSLSASLWVLAIDSGNGGRKVGIVIDASGSMEDNDPRNLRLQAAKLLVDKLISPSEVTGDQTADEVAVIEFTHTADVLYPLGDPSGAGPAVDGIIADGGTFIGSGVNAAIDELTKNSAAAGQTGILVLTDGVDDPSYFTPETIASIDRAQELGIRVSFGFLSIDSTQQDPEIIEAILRSGGIFATINTADDIGKVVAQALLNGLVGEPGKTKVILLSDVETAGMLDQTGSNTFTYTAKEGEEFNVTLTSDDRDPVSLKVTLRDPSGKEVASAVTDPDTGVAFVEYTAQAAGTITIEITPEGNKKSGLFSVKLLSSLDPCAESPVQIPPSNSTYIPTQSYHPPSPTGTSVVTAAAAPMGNANLAVGFGLLLLPTVFGVLY